MIDAHESSKTGTKDMIQFCESALAQLQGEFSDLDLLESSELASSNANGVSNGHLSASDNHIDR